jgi:hypothetical protein
MRLLLDMRFGTEGYPLAHPCYGTFVLHPRTDISSMYDVG